ncbi:uncharacterized protein LOC108942252 [Arapaima gigas]
MEFNTTDLSLHIEDLTETDSGVYSVETTDSEGQLTDVAKYNLHVQEAVPKPTLKLKLLQLNSSGLSCKVSVNCSVRDSWVSGTCDQLQCSQVHLSPGSDVDLSVKSERGTIFCSGSNGVSRETQSEPLTSVCVKPPAPYFTTWEVLIGGVVVLVAALICGALIYKQKCSQVIFFT